MEDKSTWQTFKRLAPYISVYKLGLFVAILALIVNALSEAYMISLLKPLLDEGFGSADSNFLKIMPFLILGMMFVRGLSGFISGYCMSWVASNIVMTIRRQIFSHFMSMPVSFFDKESTGELLSRITYDSEQVASATSNALVKIVRETTSIIALLGLMFWNSWELSLVLLIVAPIVAFAISFVSKRFRKISTNMQTAMGKLTSTSEQMLKGHRTVLSFNGQKIEKERFDQMSNHMRQQSMKMVVAQGLANPIIQMIASLALVSILFLASFDSIKESLTPGTFTVIFSAMFGLLRPLKGLTSVTSDFQRGMAACNTLFNLLDLETEKDNGQILARDIKGDIKVKNISFKYEGKEENIFNKLSLNINSGERVALVGKSGSGKSTIANLLPRFYDIQSGIITLDGISISEFKLAELRSSFAIVSQHVHLFNDTILNNIAYASENKHTIEEIKKAADLAHATEFIEKLDHGFDTVIGENGTTLSGGQRQRIAIARALLQKAPILILDEATSALDNESEKAIQNALEELEKGKTVITIAHRLSTIENSDKIYVFEEGEIVEEGSHNELLELNGYYSRLHNQQK
jgi:subfamily B ATP-binding cassette protein MsbA